MEIAAIEAQLPWGFHDCYIESMVLDWMQSKLTLYLRVPISDSQDLDRRCRVDLTQLQYCAIERPRENDPSITDAGLLASSDQEHLDEYDRDLQRRTGCFFVRFFADPWNSHFQVAAGDATLEWLESGPQPARGASRAIFPGEMLPDPSPNGKDDKET